MSRKPRWKRRIVFQAEGAGGREGAPWEERVVECPVHKENEQGKKKGGRKGGKRGRKVVGTKKACGVECG